MFRPNLVGLMQYDTTLRVGKLMTVQKSTIKTSVFVEIYSFNKHPNLREYTF